VPHIKDILSVLSKPHCAPQVIVKLREKLKDPDAAKVLQALEAKPPAVDEVVRRCQVSAAAVAEVLLALELDGRLERHWSSRVS